MKKYLLFLAVALTGVMAFAQKKQPAAPADTAVAESVTRYRYRVTFTDKKNCGYSVKHPEKFLSEKALARRARYGVQIDGHDLPLTQKYLKQVSAKAGWAFVNASKWNNTAVFETADSASVDAVRALPFVSAVRLVWISPAGKGEDGETDRRSLVTNRRDTLDSPYGHSERQVSMIGVDRLHAEGFTGKGVTIAVLDGGFYNADIIGGLRGVKVLGTRNFVRPQKSVYEEGDHGMMVLSCIAANTPNFLVGTAPDASFYLLVSEDGDTEQMVEEDNWCAALEYADSLGCDIATSSLGYTGFDHKFMDFPYSALDGCSRIISRSASLAASRGLLVVNSAGNSGMVGWKKIGVPADAVDMLTVGAVSKDGTNAFFSSVGNAADGRVKPDVMAMGVSCAVYGDNGELSSVNGTSFSCPIMCGAAACLIQAFPHKTPVEIIHALQQSADRAAAPDNIYGYGIPDLPKAAAMLRAADALQGEAR